MRPASGLVIAAQVHNNSMPIIDTTDTIIQQEAAVNMNRNETSRTNATNEMLVVLTRVARKEAIADAMQAMKQRMHWATLKHRANNEKPANAIEDTMHTALEKMVKTRALMG